jgi:hypothetical protein
MKAKFLLIIAIVAITSCSRKDNKEVITKFVFFAHSGFVKIDPSKHTFDSTKLDVRQYLEYEPDSVIKFSKRRFLQTREYFTINPNLFKGLLDTLNNNLINNKFEKEIKYPDYPVLYDGWVYAIYFRTSYQHEDLINYIPTFTHDSLLQVLHDQILKFFAASMVGRSEFKLDSIVGIDASILFKNYPPPPPPSKVDVKDK